MLEEKANALKIGEAALLLFFRTILILIDPNSEETAKHLCGCREEDVIEHSFAAAVYFKEA